VATAATACSHLLTLTFPVMGIVGGAPANFLSSGDFEIQTSSADCANGYMTGPGSFVGGGAGVAPEPGTLLLFASGLLLVYRHSKNART
jgi:hypothetical protein